MWVLMKDGIEENYGRKVNEKELILPFLGRITPWYWYQTGVVPVPLMQRKNGTGTIQSGTSTTLQNRFGTGTKHSGTGTIGSCNPSF